MPSVRSGVAVSPSNSWGVEVVDDAPICPGLCMVELVDDDDAEGICRNVRDPVRRQGLNARENVLPPLGASAADVELAEVTVAKDLPVGPQRLLKNLPPMCHEQQPWPVATNAKPLVVQSCNDCLSGAGGGHHKIAMPIMNQPLDLDRVEDLLLVGKRPHGEPGDGDRDSIALAGRPEPR